MEGLNEVVGREGEAEPVRKPRSSWELLDDNSGVIYVEYIVLVLFIGILVSLAIIGIGMPLLESFRMTQSFIGAPIP